MAEPQAFRTALTRLGYSVDTALFIFEECFDDFNQLCSFDKDSIISLNRSISQAAKRETDLANAADPPDNPPNLKNSLVAEHRLLGLIYWVKVERSFGRQVTSAQINEQLADRWKQLEARDARQDKLMESVTFKPPPLKTEKDWVSYKTYVVSFTKKIRNVAPVRMAYLIRSNDDPMPGTTDFADEDDRRVKTYPLAGEDFETDNKQLFDYLEESLTDTSFYCHIKGYARMKNGRGAWLALVNALEGDAHLGIRATRAKQRLQTVIYDGKSKRFTFDQYVSVHKDAHAELELPEINEPYTPVQKVEAFLLNILDPKLDGYKMTCHTEQEKRNDLEKTIAYLHMVISKLDKETAVGRSARLATVGQEGKVAWIPRKDPVSWKDMSKQARVRHVENNKLWKQQNPGKEPPSKGGGDGVDRQKSTFPRNAKRKIAALERENKELKRAKVGGTPGNNAGAGGGNGTAGGGGNTNNNHNQFGRDAHRRS